MNIDDRLDRLTERHEALTQSVELLARTTHEHTQQMREQGKQITEIMEAAARLLHVAQIREQRITRLEGGEQ